MRNYLQLETIEYIHSRGFIHRDVKPDNFLLGRGTKSHVVHTVDFGLARRWKHPINGALVHHSTSEELSGFIGTLPFASKSAHLCQGVSCFFYIVL
jgi:serine/threonine protein kinase